MKNIETKRLVLREFALEDFAALDRAVYADPDVRRYCGRVRRFEELSGRLVYVVESPVGEKIREGGFGDEGFGSWTVRRREDDQLVGQIVLGPADRAYWIVFESDPDSPYTSFEVELNCALGTQYRGMGYAAEACRAVVRYALEELRLRRLVTHLDEGNAMGIALARRLGFRIENNLHPEYGGLVAVLDNNFS